MYVNGRVTKVDRDRLQDVLCIRDRVSREISCIIAWAAQTATLKHKY
jgi:hypothetical protein